ncbi:hypothetical protein ES703_40226 [subsurface metagenome]
MVLRFLSELILFGNLDNEFSPRPKSSKDSNWPIVSGTDSRLLVVRLRNSSFSSSPIDSGIFLRLLKPSFRILSLFKFPTDSGMD